MNIFRMLFAGLCFCIIISCNKQYDFIETNYHRLDLSGIEGKIFTEFNNVKYSNFPHDNLTTFKSSCDSILVYCYSTSSNVFFEVSDSLSFPKLFDEDNSFLYYYMGRLLPLNSAFSDNELKSVLFINKYWHDAEYSGVWIILSTESATSNFIVLNNLGNMEIKKKWEKAKNLLAKLKFN